jgi:TolB-like protein/AraC-like DNA-binding protein/Tfp pilus assembly protein PilF
MSESLSMDQAFIRKLTDIVLANLANENFGVEELAKEAGMSRINLYRKLRSLKHKDVIHFIREIRLERAMEMLQNNEGTVSEITYKVGFGSSPYFIKCFHEYYGFTPGDIKRRESGSYDFPQTDVLSNSSADHQGKPIIPMLYFQKNMDLRMILIVSMGIITGLVLIWLFYILVLKSPNDQERSGLQNPVKSIVVLPFKNLSDDPENQWFADGVIEDILNNLSRIREIRVISRTTSEQFRESTLTTPEIADKLKAKYVLEGSVQKQSNKIRINVQLIDAGNDQHLWSGKYVRDITDIFAVQSDIAFQIADNLATKLSSEEIEQIRKAPTKSAEAYNLYLYGRFFWSKRTEEGLRKGIEYFEKAIAIDPDYALAYAGLADAYFIQSWWGLSPFMEGWTKAKESALRAIDIDNNLAEAHSVLGGILTWYEFKWEEAEKEFLHAIELKPSYSIAHQYYSELLNILGQKDKARIQINLALELDPLFYILHNESAWFYYNEGKMNEALDECRKTQELNPDFKPSNNINFLIYVKRGEDLKAIDTLQKWILLDTLNSKNTNIVKDVYNRSGMNGIFDWLIELDLKNLNPNFLKIAQWYAILDKKNEALTCLERAFDKLRSEPRFQVIMKKMGLSDYK